MFGSTYNGPSEGVWNVWHFNYSEPTQYQNRKWWQKIIHLLKYIGRSILTINPKNRYHD